MPKNEVIVVDAASGGFLEQHPLKILLITYELIEINSTASTT